MDLLQLKLRLRSCDQQDSKDSVAGIQAEKLQKRKLSQKESGPRMPPNKRSNRKDLMC